MKEKRVLAANVVLTLAVLVGNYFYQSLDFSYPIKLFCSFSFGLMGVLNCICMAGKGKNGVLYCLTLGILFSCAGDIAINPSFVAGAAMFALGHILFVAAYFMHRGADGKNLALCALLAAAAAAFVWLCPILRFDPPLFRYICVAYAAIISVMVGKAVGNVRRESSLFTRVLAVSSVLFFVSDLMLLLAWFSSITGWTSHACMALYYPAMCLFAHSLLVYGR